MKKILLLAAAVLAMCACCKKAESEKASHVIIIGLDGWGSWCFEKGDYPFIKEMMKEGSYTLDKRTVLPSSSGPNWGAMMNGTPVEMTGIHSNSDKPDFKPLVLTEHNAQPTIFHQLKLKCPDAPTGVICEWGDFMNYTDAACVDFQKKIHDPGTNTEAVVEESVKYILEAKPTLCFVHIDALDHMGHAYGQGSAEFYAELPLVDERVRKIVQAVKDAGIYDDSVIILTSDHGHEGTGHGGISMLEMETPFVIWGKGIKKNHKITKPFVQFDMAAIVAEILDLEKPDSWRAIAPDVFEED